jgi:hypothetical protein
LWENYLEKPINQFLGMKTTPKFNISPDLRSKTSSPRNLTHQWLFNNTKRELAPIFKRYWVFLGLNFPWKNWSIFNQLLHPKSTHYQITLSSAHLLIKGFPMVPRAFKRASWFGRSQCENETDKQTTFLINR